MSLGLAPRQTAMLGSTAALCDGRVAADSIYGLLHRECHRLFADELFADLFCEGRGRRSVPPMIVAVVMVLQRIEGCSDREAVDRFTYDARWKYACGGLDFAYPGFVHTVLVDMRARLAASERPERIFEVVLETAKRAGLVGRRRVLDSTALYDAVATMDTVTLVRSAIRGVLRACDAESEAELRAVLRRDDEYLSAGKPTCDYEDPEARGALIDALAKDAHAVLVVLDGRELEAALAQAAAVLAAVAGQDLDRDAEGVFRIARRVARDRVISTVDPQARHGHKTSARGFDGYKGHVAIDPDSELITATAVTAGNVGDAAAARELLADELADREPAEPEPADPEAAEPPEAEATGESLAVYGDSAYGAGPLLAMLEHADARVMCKVQPPSALAGRLAKDAFEIDLDAGHVTCPAGQLTPLLAVQGGHVARFGVACAGCRLAAQCTTATDGRSIRVGPHEQQLTRARERQADPEWKADYRATRPKVERKIGHLMRRKHGGRRARVRGQTKVDADFSLLAGAVNLARLAMLGITHNGVAWTAATGR
jgi:Transposase DDE domain/Transposase domain (DUF772)